MDVEVQVSHNIREVPSYKSFARHGDTGRDDTRRVAFAVDLNAYTRWLMWMEGATRMVLHLTRGIEGNAAGKVKESLQLVVTSFARVETDNVLRIAVEGNLSGEVEVGVF